MRNHNVVACIAISTGTGFIIYFFSQLRTFLSSNHSLEIITANAWNCLSNWIKFCIGKKEGHVFYRLCASVYDNKFYSEAKKTVSIEWSRSIIGLNFEAVLILIDSNITMKRKPKQIQMSTFDSIWIFQFQLNPPTNNFWNQKSPNKKIFFILRPMRVYLFNKDYLIHSIKMRAN